MQFLFDTHTLLWYLTDDSQLSLHAKQIIDEPANQLFVSVACLWEIAIKVSLGKLLLPQPFSMFIPQQMVENQFDILPISLEHLSKVAVLPFIHRDPFDRIMVAQSIVENIPFISQDPLIQKYEVAVVW